MVPAVMHTMLMVDEESFSFKEVTNAPAPATQKIADIRTEETLVRFTISGYVAENKLAAAETVSLIIIWILFFTN